MRGWRSTTPGLTATARLSRRRSPLRPPGTWQRLQPWLAGAVAVAITAGTTWFLGRPTVAPEPVNRFAIALAADARLTNAEDRVVAVSPDGMYVAISAQDQLLLRRADELAPTPLPGTTDARTPFFSPDSQHLAFWAGGRIRRMAVTGGAPVVVGSSGQPYGASWGDDGFIYVGLGPDGIARLPETGGEPEVVVEVATGEAHGPQLIPGGSLLLFTWAPGPRRWDQAAVVAQSLTTPSDRVVLVRGGREGRVTSTGHLLYVLDGVLFGQRFDARSLEVSGVPVSILEGVQTSDGDSTGAAQYDVTANGTLVYVLGEAAPRPAFRLAWVDRNGLNEELLPVEAQQIVNRNALALSPDRTEVAVEIEGDPDQLWLFDVDRPGGRRLTRDGGFSPVWSADGEWVYFGVPRDQDFDIWRKRADLSGEAEEVYAAPGDQWPSAMSQDGAYLFFYQTPDADGSWGLGRLSLQGDPVAEMILEGPANEVLGRPSPDGRFLAYMTNDVGNFEVYVLEIETGRKWLLSSGLAYHPTWTANNEIVFWSGADQMMSVTVTTEPTFTYAPPQLLHRRPRLTLAYAVTSDGQRFLHAVLPEAQGDVPDQNDSQRVLVVQNWFEELKRLVPVR